MPNHGWRPCSWREAGDYVILASFRCARLRTPAQPRQDISPFSARLELIVALNEELEYILYQKSGSLWSYYGDSLSVRRNSYS